MKCQTSKASKSITLDVFEAILINQTKMRHMDIKLILHSDVPFASAGLNNVKTALIIANMRDSSPTK